MQIKTTPPKKDKVLRLRLSNLMLEKLDQQALVDRKTKSKIVRELITNYIGSSPNKL